MPSERDGERGRTGGIEGGETAREDPGAAAGEHMRVAAMHRRWVQRKAKIYLARKDDKKDEPAKKDDKPAPAPAADDEKVDANAPKNVYNSKRDAPGWPASFTRGKGQLTKNKVNNAQLLEQLRAIAPGDWQKVYEDGFVGADQVSVHYFQHASGKVFGLKVVPGWSNGG